MRFEGEGLFSQWLPSGEEGGKRDVEQFQMVRNVASQFIYLVLHYKKLVAHIS